MATNKNINECGWFYHAPSKKVEDPIAVDSPYISQIPGLSEFPEDEFGTEPQGLYFKDTDSKFVRMAKEGGRKDLLIFREPSTASKEAQSYPRVDWFYLEDNAIEDKDQNTPKDEWKFLLPEYMVHDSYTPSLVEGASPTMGSYGPGDSGRVPYARDEDNMFQKEGRNAIDKKVRIEEHRKPGYGVRNSKPAQKSAPQASKPTPKTTTHKEVERITQGDRHGNMNKILSYDYEREWLEQMKITGDKDSGKKNAKATSPRSRRVVKNNENMPAAGFTSKKETTEDKSPFIMSKFKNVQSRVDSHQPIQGKQPVPLPAAN